MISKQQYLFKLYIFHKWENCLLWHKITPVLYTFGQMVHLCTGSVAWLIASDLPFYCFIWLRSGQPYPRRYMNIWIVNKNRIWDMKWCLIIWRGSFKWSQNALRRSSMGSLDLNFRDCSIPKGCSAPCNGCLLGCARQSCGDDFHVSSAT